MKIKLLFVSILLVFVTLQSSAQISLGFKSSFHVSEFTDQDGFGVLSRFIEEGADVGVYSNFKKGVAVAALTQIEFNKFFSIIVEPGFQVENKNSLNFEIDIFIPNSHYDVNPIFFEMPTKFKFRLPLFEDKVGIFSTFGVKPSKWILSYDKEKLNQNRILAKNDSKLIDDWELDKLLGFGIDVKFGKHTFLMDVDYSAQPLSNRNSDSDFNFKTTQIGLGYLVAI